MSNKLFTVDRYKYNPDWTIGSLIDARFAKTLSFTIEDEIRAKKVKGETAIPFGIFPLKTRISPKFSGAFMWSDAKKDLIETSAWKKAGSPKGYIEHELIWIADVPGFDFILLHWGNTDDDTDGCLLVGNKLGIINNQEAVLNSKATYIKLYKEYFPLIKTGDYTIEYIKHAA